MSFMRSRVAPVVAKPPPGQYDAPLTVHLHTETPGATIIFTLDGTTPVSNSDREHGFRCEHYKPLSGFTLRSGGRHVLTVVATRKGFVGTEVQRFQYVLRGDVVERRRPNLRDKIIERRFNAMVDLDPSMPLRLARARSPGLLCALVDTCPKALLREQSRTGKKMALFELTHSTRTVSRSDKYRRIVAPSMSLTVPGMPPVRPGVAADAEDSPPLSLRSSASHSLRPLDYEGPSSLRASPVSAADGDTGDGIPGADLRELEAHGSRCEPYGAASRSTIGTPPAGSRASTSHGRRAEHDSPREGMAGSWGLSKARTAQLTTSSRVLVSRAQSAGCTGEAIGVADCVHHRPRSRPHTTLGHPRLSPTPSLLRRSPCPSAAPAATRTQLAIFEHRARLLPKADEYSQPDAEERQEDANYTNTSCAAIRREADRLAPISALAAKKLKITGPQQAQDSSSGRGDIAAGDNSTLVTLLRAKELCHSDLRRIVATVPYRTLHQKFVKASYVVVADVEVLARGALTTQQVQACLRPLLMAPEGAGYHDPKKLLLFSRFIVWVARPIPEAVFGLMFAVWRVEAVAAGVEPLIGKISILSILETYRRTRGASQEAIGQLFHGFHSGIPWSEDGLVSSGMFQHYVSTHVPIVDAAVGIMNDLNDPMYQEPTQLWSPH